MLIPVDALFYCAIINTRQHTQTLCITQEALTMKLLLTIPAILTICSCSSTGDYDVPVTKSEKAEYENKYEFNVDHMPNLDRQILIREKLKSSVCDGGPVKTFGVTRKWGSIVCENGAHMRFEVSKVKLSY